MTITITRKFLTILISNVAFGHMLTQTQWFGCTLVFAGLLVKPVLHQAGFIAGHGSDNTKPMKEAADGPVELSETATSTVTRSGMRRRAEQQTRE